MVGVDDVHEGKAQIISVAICNKVQKTVNVPIPNTEHVINIPAINHKVPFVWIVVPDGEFFPINLCYISITGCNSHSHRCASGLEIGLVMERKVIMFMFRNIFYIFSIFFYF